MGLERGVLLAFLLCCFTVGASCDEGSGDGGGDEESSSGASAQGDSQGDAAPIRSLEQIDVSGLGKPQRERWVALVNDQLSPCGEPVSVARCVADERDCDRCVQAAGYVARLVGEGYQRAEIEELYRLRYSEQTKKTISTDGAPVRGSSMAPVSIVEFSDFECPFCAQAHPVLKQVVRESEGKVRLAFKHFPLDSHTRAQAAARAAVAAGRQGKFWQMHDKLFDNQGRFETADLQRYAREIGLDVKRFRADLESEAVQKRVERDKADGRELGVEGTPAIFVNGRRFEEPIQSLSAYVKEELER